MSRPRIVCIPHSGFPESAEVVSVATALVGSAKYVNTPSLSTPIHAAQNVSLRYARRRGRLPDSAIGSEEGITKSRFRAIAALSVRLDRTHQEKRVTSIDRGKPLSIAPSAGSWLMDSGSHRTVPFCGTLCPAIAWAIRRHPLVCIPIPQSVPESSSLVWSGFPYRRHQVPRAMFRLQ
jgi:hypothetical protein